MAYELRRCIGEGATASVFEAKQEASQKLVAVKKFPLSKVSMTFNQHAAREIKFLSEIAPHDNVVQMHDVFIANKSVHIVLEYLPTDLRCFRGSQLPQALVKTCTLQLLHGVAFLHAQNIMHRDLKPGNILVGWTKETGLCLKITDLGIARVWDPKGTNLVLATEGTRAYLPPEILCGERAILNIQQLDMWAVGCIVGELLRGAPLFEDPSDLNRLSMILDLLHINGMPITPGCYLANFTHKPAESPERVIGTFPMLPPEGIEFILRVLALDPVLRISAFGASAAPWFAAHPLPLPATECGPPPERVEPVSRTLPSGTAVSRLNQRNLDPNASSDSDEEDLGADLLGSPASGPHRAPFALLQPNFDSDGDKEPVRRHRDRSVRRALAYKSPANSCPPSPDTVPLRWPSDIEMFSPLSSAEKGLEKMGLVSPVRPMDLEAPLMSSARRLEFPELDEPDCN